MKVRAERMLAQAGDPSMLATDLAEYLSKRGMPFREAHGVVARLSKHCAEHGLAPATMPLEDLRKFSEVFDKDLFELLTPKASVEGKTSPGGTAPALVLKRSTELLKDSE